MIIDSDKRSEEKIFYEDADNIKVTSARFIVDKETYPIANISSVKNKFSPPRRFGAFFWAAIGLIWSLSVVGAVNSNGAKFDPMPGFGIGAILFYIAWFFYKNGKAKYIVALMTSGSEHKALESKNKEKINCVVQALNDAIVFRS